MDGWIEYRSLESTLDSNGFIKKSAATTMGCDTIHGLMIGYDPTTRHHGSPLPFCVCFGAHSCFRFVSFLFASLHCIHFQKKSSSYSSAAVASAVASTPEDLLEVILWALSRCNRS
uniref:Uncharacterized protein n=1 Tax=Pseudo-nitzschia australis TaxID=44445 RepID=A0A7S4ADA7_9STRA